MLAFKEIQEDEELILEVTELQKGRGVVAVLALCAAALLLVTGSDGAFTVLNGLIFRRFVSETFDTELFE